MIAAVIATDPYSSSIIQPGTNHGRPTVRRCQTMYVGIMLTVQMMIGSVEIDAMNGSSQSRYQGYTTGAHRSDAAIGQANASNDHAAEVLLSHTAVSRPPRTASPTASWGDATRSRAANTGSLKRKLWTYLPSEPIGICPRLRNGMYRSPKHDCCQCTVAHANPLPVEWQ